DSSGGAQPGSLLTSMPRDEWFAMLFIIACINGLGSQIIWSVRLLGWADAAFTTFSMSAIVWVACYAGVRLILEETSAKLHAKGFVFGPALLIPIALPFGRFSWLAISLLVFTCSGSAPRHPRGAAEPSFSWLRRCQCFGTTSCSDIWRFNF